ncbi:helicase-exonuclease AddAB subunit AddA [Pedosphaera parvula]|uniref:DNA 3'-5' helicase n=1 Tax=Pedosphaera parvula (strain Ellin514) TaxID=320771 RepID=B9XFA1_PEDPL|nr:helicase-exonuclease AddAB subunit AddA [Pedosphaera parvula]EEF61599.1 recombination helicase AddA [Pedosphaera parvula Ellin514]
MSFTPAQQEAIIARGNVLVVAGAGTGKTRTLVERCLHCLVEEKPPTSLDEILMVTFTDAAAAEMRQRIRARLEQELAKHTDDLRWTEQLTIFDTAHIGTLHSFCLQLVRQHFYELELDPQLTVLPEEEARLLADETLENLLQSHYAGDAEGAEAVQQLIQVQGRGWDQPIRTLVLRLHHYTQTLRDPADWLKSQLEMFASPEPAQWRTWLIEGITDWRNRWLPALQSEKSDNLKATECCRALASLLENPSLEQGAEALENIWAADLEWPRGKKTDWRKPLEDFLEEATFLRSLARKTKEVDPLAEDWDWIRGQMTSLLGLAEQFSAAFSLAKRELGVVDFHDLEQHSLQLLWDRNTKQATAVARQWRKKLRFVFVDEYQDINDAQDAILKALSREGEESNRFLVGDVKQSIYRFRLADPHIFQNYIETWRGADGKAIPLVDNFRSREAILNFINSLFEGLMRRDIGSVPYDDEARLRFGNAENRVDLSCAKEDAPRVELHLRLKGSLEAKDMPEGEGEGSRAWTEMMNLEEAEKEARLIGKRLLALKAEKHLAWDEHTKAMRPVTWSDMAVLLRSPARKAESYAKEFSRLGIPLLVARGGFYESMEVTDLLSLLQLLDNPLQDVPTLAVLHSPLVGMSLDELATIRLKLTKGPIWMALRRFHESDEEHAGWKKADRFLKNFASWRRLARQVSLSRCLEAVLSETHYAAWLLTQHRGEQRHANVQRLLGLAQQFDRFQRQGLFRFLRFIDAQQAAETEPEVAAVAEEDAVSLMSVHQSKGLEFPVVVVADLGKPFNMMDLRAEIMLDDKFGLCPQVKPPHTGQRYPSLPYWLARQRQKQEMLGEEMRLLYVALTRARDTLILTGSISEPVFNKRWLETSELTAATLLAARNFLDWLAGWCTKITGTVLKENQGRNSLFCWKVYEDDTHLIETSPSAASEAEKMEQTSVPMDAASWKKLQQKLSWIYPHSAATHEPAKTSVSALRRRMAEDIETEARPLFELKSANPQTKAQQRKNGNNNSERLSAAEVGTTHHSFLQMVSLERVGSVEELRREAKRLEAEQLLTVEEAGSLDFPALAAFWKSELGLRIQRQSRHVRRELAFTVRFSPEEVAGNTPKDPELFDEEFVVVQGVADLTVLLPDQIWLVDFKTDRITSAELAEKVKIYEPQLQLYAQALARIYHRPVTETQLYFLALKRSVAVKTGRSNKLSQTEV